MSSVFVLLKDQRIEIVIGENDTVNELKEKVNIKTGINQASSSLISSVIEPYFPYVSSEYFCNLMALQLP
jgi:hypothetical protein